MNKSEYQMLRFSVECHVANFISDPVAVRALVDKLMGELLKTLAASQTKQAASKRSFVTFRRDRKFTAPSWAYRKPGIDSRLPRV